MSRANAEDARAAACDALKSLLRNHLTPEDFDNRVAEFVDELENAIVERLSSGTHQTNR